MTPVVIVGILSVLAGLGVLAAATAAALPAPAPAGDRLPWDAGVPAPALSLRDRINVPFQAFAERSGRNRRLNGGLTLAEHLARANLKWRTSEFVMIQIGFMAAWALLA